MSGTTAYRIIGFMLCLDVLAAGPAMAAPTSIKIASFNIHYIRPAENRTAGGVRK